MGTGNAPGSGVPWLQLEKTKPGRTQGFQERCGTAAEEAALGRGSQAGQGRKLFPSARRCQQGAENNTSRSASTGTGRTGEGPEEEPRGCRDLGKSVGKGGRN